MRSPRGFDNLSQAGAPTAAALRRSALLGALVGLLGVTAWVQGQQQALDDLRSDLSGQQAELARLQATQARLVEQVRRQQVASTELARMQAARQERAHLLTILEDLAQARGPRLMQLRLDAQGLRIQGQTEPEHLQAWVSQRPAAAVGLGPPTLRELLPVEPGPAMRFVLSWPPQVGKAAP